MGWGCRSKYHHTLAILSSFILIQMHFSFNGKAQFRGATLSCNSSYSPFSLPLFSSLSPLSFPLSPISLAPFSLSPALPYCYINYTQLHQRIFFIHTRSDPGICLLSGTRMAHEGAHYLMGHFRLRSTLEPTLHQARFRLVINLES